MIRLGYILPTNTIPTATNDSFSTWIKSNNMINISSDAAVVYITYEGITNFISLTDFDKKSIKSIPTTRKKKILFITDDPAAGITAESAVPGSNISLVAIHWLIVMIQSAKEYTSIGRMMNATNMHYSNLLSNFNI